MNARRVSDHDEDGSAPPAQRTLEATDVAIVAVDRSGRVRRWNPAAARLFGYSEQEAVGGHLTMLMPPDRRAEWQDLMGRIRRSRGTIATERAYVTKEGGRVHAMTRVTALYDESGEPSGAVVVAWDVGPQMRLQRQHTALLATAHAAFTGGSPADRARRTARALHGALHARATMVHLLDEGGRNLQLVAHLGLSGQGAQRWQRVSVDSESGDVILQAHRTGRLRAMHDAEAKPADLSGLRAPARTARVAVPLRAGDAAIGVITLALAAEDSDDPGLQATMGVAADFLAQAIHERDLVGRLETTVEDLRNANRDLDTFARALAHDLGEPVRSLRLMTRLVVDRHGTRMPAEARTHLERIARAADRLKQMLDGLRSHAKIARVVETAGLVALDEIVRDVEETLGPQLREKGAEFEVEGPLPQVRAPKTHLFEVLLNLVANALKFNRSRTPRVRLGARLNNGTVYVWVEDNGIGIPEGARARVFELFGRAHAREDFPGTGTGLALVAKYVETWGGRVWNEDAEDGGTRFWFTAPEAAAAETPAVEPARETQDASS